METKQNQWTGPGSNHTNMLQFITDAQHHFLSPLACLPWPLGAQVNTVPLPLISYQRLAEPAPDHVFCHKHAYKILDDTPDGVHTIGETP